MIETLVNSFKNTGTIHHAYVLEGGADVLTEHLIPFFETHVGFSVHGNPDFMHISIDSFGIDDSRFLKDLQLRKAVGVDGRKVFVISIGSITHEAQHSLLKVLEEPTAGTHFFFLLPSAHVLLPTVLSRVVLVHKNESFAGGSLYKRFIASTPAQRLTMLEEIIEGKDKAQAIAFVEHLQSEWYVLWQKKQDSRAVDALRQLESVRSYLFDRSSSVKMLMEQVALALPIC